ncbi:MAG: sugar transferase [Bdellovibrionales bacterium]|nr:sugar transferase [Bdellovibrionales bacterium]
MLKRSFDLVSSFLGLLITSPITLTAAFLVWLQDFKSPFYIAPRVGKSGKIFKMVKLRSMVVNADKTGVASTSSNDMRITPIGKFIRKFKLDELVQLYNVLKGDMSLVGPRPNVKEKGTDLYTEREKKLLTVRPGITDLASIVFADEGSILANSTDPDKDYDQLIRPWKSRLALVYVEHSNIILDVKIIYLTLLTIISREQALRGVHNILKGIHVEASVREIVLRKAPLTPSSPP